MQIDQTIELDRVKLNPLVEKVRGQYKSLYPDPRSPGVYSRYDWARVSYALDLAVPEGSILDVGIGAGQFINILASSGRFTDVTGLDVGMHSKFVKLVDNYEITIESVDRLPFADDSFDCITCMEVLEHIGPKAMRRGLEQLRRVCRHQLILSVPYNEPLPLSKYHRQQFTDEVIDDLFPNARKHLLKKPNVPWLLVEEQLS